MSQVVSGEHAHQLALRVQQLCALQEVWNELQSARAMPYGNSGNRPGVPLSDATMLLLLLSMLYSVFDSQKSAVNLARLQPESDAFEAEIASVVEAWEEIKTPVTRIRHNFAFHGSAKKDGTQDAVKALAELGDRGMACALELIEELRVIYPWLVVEANGGFLVPPALETAFRTFLAKRRAAHGAVLDARRQWSHGNPLEHLEIAASCRREAAIHWKKLCEGLTPELTEEKDSFLQAWEADLNGLEGTIESLKSLHAAVGSAQKTLESVVASGSLPTVPSDPLERYVATVSRTLPTLKWLVRTRPEVLEAFTDLEESASRLATVLNRQCEA